jgi:FixJ family two-component response regulator
VHAWLTAHRPELVSKLIFITGDIVNEETAQTLMKTGAPCVEKPFRIAQLMDVVKKVMGTPQ